MAGFGGGGDGAFAAFDALADNRSMTRLVGTQNYPRCDEK